MPWNLNDLLSVGEQREFHLPVASDPLGGTQLPQVSENDFIISDFVTNNLPGVQIKVSVPTGGFPDADGLPAAAIRLHAMLRGKLKYLSAFEGLSRCLILKIPPIWPRVMETVKWFERWREAGCQPYLIIYENVDETHLRQMLEAIDLENPLPNRILFPPHVTAETKLAFIGRFLDGTGSDSDTVAVGPGTPIGKFNDDFVSPVFKTLRLHVRYSGHTEAEPHAMHPRECFHLLFGNDSRETQPQTGHPLLRRIHHLGEQDAATFPKTKRTSLRPPLRTHARVVWEADLELGQTNDGSHWNLAAELAENRFLNTVPGFDRSYGYEGYSKCNLFGFEILLRSGFRVRMMRTPMANNNIQVFYHRVNRLVREARDATFGSDGLGLVVYQGEKIWGRRWELILDRKPLEEQATEINRLMEEEGRCFYLIQELDYPNCRECSGHFMVVKQVKEAFPADYPTEELRGLPTVFWEYRGAGGRGTKRGLGYIYADVYEAIDEGLQNKTRIALPKWPGSVKNSLRHLVTTYDNDLLLIEAFPGKDPNTESGIADLCSIHQRDN